MSMIDRQKEIIHTNAQSHTHATLSVDSAYYWSLGGALIEESKIKFDALAKKLASLPLIPDESTLAGPG